ncbi:MAG: EF-P beta-lysylation protein EpmB [Legionellales bacterium]|jgi:L-lysine 2,3-aminomutase|nr:EF-P beta-lysylation protein EpmB [Legionellales bacterium]
MIAQKPLQKQKEQWQVDLATSFSSLPAFLDYCEINYNDLSQQHLASKDFRFFVTKSWANRIVKSKVNDPMLLQVLPQPNELIQEPGYSLDPLSEQQQSPIAGLIHKYHGRVLLTLTGQCAIYCRYCFRRNFPYQENQFNRVNWEKIIAYLKANTDIYEVILSGGDPLIMGDNILTKIVTDLAAIPHIKYLRIHSRIPVVLPSRITTSLIKTLKMTRLLPTIVIHSNHPQELNDEVCEKLRSIKNANINLLNQAVLLKNINDSAKTLAELSHKLYQAGVMPYYIHRLDKIAGSSHFYLTPHQENKIITELLSLLPGYLVPKFVEETPNAKAKTPIKIEF